MSQYYETLVKNKTAEQILEQYNAADSNQAAYLQAAAQIRSNQELVKALQTASEESGMIAERVVYLTLALVMAAICQTIATAWHYLVWWVSHGFAFSA